MSRTLLAIRGLTVRFGGLVAVNELDLSVEEGTIAAVIGPNGAGKTTVFNALTGISPPTSGEIDFNGRPLSRTLAGKHWRRWAATGLALGLLFVLFASDVDRLWTLAVKNNSREARWDIAAGVRDALRSVATCPLVEPRSGGRGAVVSYDGKLLLGPFGSRDDSRESLAALRSLSGTGQLGPRIESDGRAFAVFSGDRTTRLELGADLGSAAEAARRIDMSLDDARRARALRIAVFVFGALFGLFGGLAVFRQTRRTPSWVARRGVARTFQNIRLFKGMTAVENVMSAIRLPRGGSKGISAFLENALPYLPPAALVAVIAARRWKPELEIVAALFLAIAAAAYAAWTYVVFRRGTLSASDADRERRMEEKALAVLDFVGLREKQDRLAGGLAYGDQRRLEIARALASEPKLLLLDEPAAGMNPSEKAALMELIRAIREKGITVLIIEHDMRVVMGISDRVTVLQYGTKIAEGTPDVVRRDPRVIEAYLGGAQV